jgi:hypothetical protein
MRRSVAPRPPDGSKQIRGSATHEIIGRSLRSREPPPELQRLFMLQPLPRHCFVLRVLVGLTPEVCAELLEISVSEFEGALYAALIELPLHRSPKA